jgi:hypothetical protein
MQIEPFQPWTFNKLHGQMDYKSLKQQTKVFHKFLLLHIRFLEKIFCSKKNGNDIAK